MIANAPEPTLSACALGPVPYAEGIRLQEAMVRARADHETGDWLLFPDHPAVLTVGRNPSPGSLRADREALATLGIALHRVARGGDITWHGPGQLVGYPILDLERLDRDLHRYLRGLEGAIGNALARFGIEAHTVPGRTGVWVGADKIASIGIAVRRWVGYHGFALNVEPDLAAFELIHPCGLRGIRMTSMARLLGDRAPAMDQVRAVVAAEVAGALGFAGVQWEEPAAVWRLAERPAEAERRAG